MMEWPSGVRKGSWTEEEDTLLRNCVHQYGEGSWHLVPSRAGLNRCRKSCRLRWLNYVKPGIKRGAFTYDEVDLIIRLHNLLGNRWSLIAGRLPGRTGNDVKNYWNTHLQKRTNKSESVVKEGQQQRHQVIRPRPWTLSKTRPAWVLQLQSNHGAQAHTAATADGDEPDDDWWESLLQLDPEIFNFK